MRYPSFDVALPTGDRRTSFDFYRGALGLEPVGEPDADGMPEPLMFAVTDATRIVLVPTVGFGWLTGDRAIAPPAMSECILSLTCDDEGGVYELVERAREAGATVVIEPDQRPWGYEGTFTDPDGHLWVAAVRAT